MKIAMLYTLDKLVEIFSQELMNTSEAEKNMKSHSLVK